jgi:hypothetical protein
VIDQAALRDKEASMCRKIIAMILALAMPAGASAGPLKEAAEKAGREMARAQSDEIWGRSPTRFWTGIALIGGGATLATLGSLELGDDETGVDDGEDTDASDDGEDSDGWANKAMLGGGIAAAAVGSVVLLTGRKKSGPQLSIRRGGVAVRQTVRF